MDLATGLLEYLRASLGEPALAYAESPAPLTGGFDTRILAFRLSGAPAAFAGRLVLRLLGAHHDPARVLRERAIQNALAELDYPAPRVLSATTDAAPLGGPFLIMECRPGVVLPAAQFIGMDRVLVRMQIRLHALDPEPLLLALDREGAQSAASGGPRFDRSVVAFDAQFAQLEGRVVRHSLRGLEPAIAWLRAHRPPEGRRVICHGDVHPWNILVADGAVSGVIDWPNAIVGDPELDVAATSVILKSAPIEASDLPAPLRWLAAAGRSLLLARYLRGYRRHRQLDPERLSYYEAAACLRALVRAGESRLSRAGVAGLPPPTRLDTASFADRLATHFARVTGVSPTLPPATVAAAAD